MCVLAEVVFAYYIGCRPDEAEINVMWQTLRPSEAVGKLEEARSEA